MRMAMAIHIKNKHRTVATGAGEGCGTGRARIGEWKRDATNRVTLSRPLIPREITCSLQLTMQLKCKARLPRPSPVPRPRPAALMATLKPTMRDVRASTALRADGIRRHRKAR